MGMTVPDEWGEWIMSLWCLQLKKLLQVIFDNRQRTKLFDLRYYTGTEQQKQTYLPKFASGEWLFV